MSDSIDQLDSYVVERLDHRAYVSLLWEQVRSDNDAADFKTFGDILDNLEDSLTVFLVISDHFPRILCKFACKVSFS